MAWAPTPPEALSLREVREDVAQIDPGFEEWLRSIYSAPQPQLLSDTEFQKLTAKMDASTRYFLQLRRNAKVEDQRELVQRALSQPETQEAPLLKEPMGPYLATALMDTPGIDAKQKQLLKDWIYAKGGRSCPRKRMILQDLKQIEKATVSADQGRQLIKTIQEFKSLSFQEDALRSLILGLQPQALKDVRQELSLAVGPYPRLVGDYPGLFDEALATPKLPSFDIFQQAEKLASEGRCGPAQEKLLKAIEIDKESKFLASVEMGVSKLELCFKVKGDKVRLTFLKDLMEPLKVRYGFLGESLSLRRQGLIHWGRDEFEAARKIFSMLLLQSEKDYPQVHTNTLFTYGRILENEGKFAEAIEKYKALVSLYPQDEQANQALSSLIVLHTLQNKTDESLEYALKLIELEAVKSPDVRDGGSVSMALYWAGKIYLEKKDKGRAEFYWSRLSQEFYSTFYGALGHYAVEKLTGKKYMLPPIQSPEFDRESLYQEFTGEERNVLRRAERLLALGMKDDAACEIREMPSAAGDTHRQLVKSIFQFAVGDWLGAVRIYQNIPKSFRITLSRGVERVLFPRAFEDTVDQYSKKVKIDPQYVNAIIRQESVFNPRAQSPVGARGLMQLMPGTARLELSSLRADYVSADKMPAVMRVKNDDSVLNDPEVNIALGVQHVHRLFQKYKNPVFVLTSYNANPRATERWMENIDSTDMILFIERIPYRETRSYVKLVMRNYFYYKRWYEGPHTAVPLFENLLPKSLVEQTASAEKIFPFQAL